MQQLRVNFVSILQSRILLIVLVPFVLGLLTFSAYHFLPASHDWVKHFRPAALLLACGQSPYVNEGFYNAPWVLIPLIPIALLPEKLSCCVLFSTGFVAYVFLAYKLGAKPLTVLIIMISYPVGMSLFWGNLEWLIFLGFLLPPRLGIFLILAKPQLGLGVAIYWFVKKWQDGYAEVLKTFAPVTLAFGLSFILFGPWILRGPELVDIWWNKSLWPYSIPIGLGFLAASIRLDRMNLAIVASPFLSPYLSTQSWSVALFGLLPMQWEPIAVSIGIWIVRILTTFHL